MTERDGHMRREKNPSHMFVYCYTLFVLACFQWHILNECVCVSSCRVNKLIYCRGTELIKTVVCPKNLMFKLCCVDIVFDRVVSVCL